MPWNDSWNEHRLHQCAICAFGALACGHCAGRTPGTPERSTLNPRVRGSSPWRRTRPELHRLASGVRPPASAWNESIRCFGAHDAHSTQRVDTQRNHPAMIGRLGTTITVSAATAPGPCHVDQHHVN